MRQKAPDQNRWPIILSVVLVGVVVAIGLVAALAPEILPAGDPVGGEGRKIASSVIFIARAWR